MRRAVLVALSAGLAVLPAAAQTGSLEILLPDAEATSDARGRVVLPVLHAGSGYIEEISMPGYAGMRMTDLRVRSNETEQLVLVLSPRLEERLRAGRQRSIVDLDKTGSSSRFSDEFIDQLPVPGRFYQNVLTLAPGVKDVDGDGNPNVHGARARDFKALVIGISNVDPLTGEVFNLFNDDTPRVTRYLNRVAAVERQFGRRFQLGLRLAF